MLNRSKWRDIGRLNLNRKRLWDALPPLPRHVLAPILRIIPLRVLLGRRFRKELAFAERSESWDRERARAYQLQQLRRICRLAYERTSFYRSRFQEVGLHPEYVRSLEDFSRLPSIDRNTLRMFASEMCVLRPGSVGADLVSTGGTGGEPVSFLIDANRSVREYAYLVSSWRRAGYELGRSLAVLRGRVVRPERSGLYHECDPILRHHYYSAFHMSDGSMGRYLRHIATIGTCLLHVYPSAVAALARFIRRTHVRPPSNIHGIIAESEIVYADQRALVEEVFGCRYFSCYGHSEKCILAAECEHSSDYHVWPTYGYFELLDQEGRPVTTPGQRGEIVGTSFINTVMPFIRYRTGDFATYVGESCKACGREHTIIRNILGHRTQEVLIAADGSEIPWAAVNIHDDTFLRVRHFQFRQERPGYAVVRVVPTVGFGHRDRERIVAALAQKLNGQLHVALEVVESIPLSPQGKTVYVVQRAKREQASDFAGGVREARAAVCDKERATGPESQVAETEGRAQGICSH